jgi:hypothetical protein
LKRARAPKAKAVAPASALVRDEWLRRVEAEYRSAAITQHLGLWLIQIAAPPDLIADSRRIVADEMIHAELSHVTFVAAGGSGAPKLVRESLALPRSRSPLEHDVLRHGVEVFCLGETVAVRLFKRLRQHCSVPEARHALDRILKDEVRHREFGWTLLEWLLSTPSSRELRGVLAAELPAMLHRVRKNYGATDGAASRPQPELSNAERAWGLMPLDEYANAVEETIVRDYAPRFRTLGIDAND